MPALIATYPVVLLAHYGRDEGGISGSSDILGVALALGLLSYGLAALGIGIGRLLWTGEAMSEADPT